MAGPTDIQRSPAGLTDLLGLRASGATPIQLAESVFGQLDMLDLYVAPRRTSTMNLTTANVSALGMANFTALPVTNVEPGNAFLVYSAYTTYLVPAASTWAGALVLRRASYRGVQGHTWIDGTQGTIAAGVSCQLGRYFERPLIVMPGDVFALNTTVFTGTGPIAPLHVDYAPILI